MAIIKVTNSKATLSKAINYITKEEKTDARLVSGINCTSESALDEMMATKELYNKLEGRQYYHYVQSFSKEDDITHDKAHELALELAEKQFKGYEVLIATHKDKEHIHSHIIVNSVSYENGAKFQSSKADLRELKEENNKICEREGYSTPEPSKDVLSEYNMKKYKSITRAVEGEYKSYLLDLMVECDNSIKKSLSKDEFIKSMEQKGYGVEWIDTRKNITFTTPEGKKVRSSNLAKTFKNDLFTKEGMLNGFEKNRELQATEGRTGKLKYRAVTGHDSEFERRADGIEQQIDKDTRLNRERERTIQEQCRSKGRGIQETSNDNTRGISSSKGASREEVRGNIGESKENFTGISGATGEESSNTYGDNKGVGNYNTRNTTDRENELEGQSEAVYSTNGNNSRDNINISNGDKINQIASGIKAIADMSKEKPEQKEYKPKITSPKSKNKKKEKEMDWDMEI